MASNTPAHIVLFTDYDPRKSGINVPNTNKITTKYEDNSVIFHVLRISGVKYSAEDNWGRQRISFTRQDNEEIADIFASMEKRYAHLLQPYSEAIFGQELSVAEVMDRCFPIEKKYDKGNISFLNLDLHEKVLSWTQGPDGKRRPAKKEVDVRVYDTETENSMTLDGVDGQFFTDLYISGARISAFTRDKRKVWKINFAVEQIQIHNSEENRVKIDLTKRLVYRGKEEKHYVPIKRKYEDSGSDTGTKRAKVADNE